jgi:hypothetical protein
MKEGLSASGLLIPREVLSPLVAGGQLTRPFYRAFEREFGSAPAALRAAAAGHSD